MARESYGAMKQGSKIILMKGREGGREGRRRGGGSKRDGTLLWRRLCNSARGASVMLQGEKRGRREGKRSNRGDMG